MKSGIQWIMGLLLLIGSGPVWGDVMIESSFKTGGIKGMGEAEGMSVQRYQGQKKWDSQTTRFTGAFLSRMVGETGTTTITRVDKGLIWTLDSKGRTYQESPLTPPKGRSEAREGKDSRESKPTARVTKSEFTVKKTGATETINGFACEEYLIAWLLEIEDLETKAKSQSTMTTRLWTTPETALMRKVKEEEGAFNKALARKLGSELSPEEANKMGMAVLGGMLNTSPEEMQKGMIRVKEEMSKIKGYPIRTVILWNVEGEKKGGSNEQEKSTSTRSSERSEGPAGFLGGLMGRMTQKKGEEKSNSPEGKESPFFSSTLEVKSLSADPIPPATFEVLEGYKKK
ncbi:MAG: hypothetical protein AB1585_13590 [Thermodesulfobacteriota bacterium]